MTRTRLLPLLSVSFCSILTALRVSLDHLCRDFMRQVLKSDVGGKINKLKSIPLTLDPSKGTVCDHLAVPDRPRSCIPR